MVAWSSARQGKERGEEREPERNGKEEEEDSSCPTDECCQLLLNVRLINVSKKESRQMDGQISSRERKGGNGSTDWKIRLFDFHYPG